MVWGSIPPTNQVFNDQPTTLSVPFGGVSQHFLDIGIVTCCHYINYRQPNDCNSGLGFNSTTDQVHNGQTTMLEAPFGGVSQHLDSIIGLVDTKYISGVR